MNHDAIDAILTFWFGAPDPTAPPTVSPALWFQKSAEVDEQIRTRFGDLLEQGARDELRGWEADTAGHLAHVVLLDQFSRNVFRDTPRAFAQDPLALASALRAIDGGVDARVGVTQRSFFYLPLMHAEDRALQARQVALYEALAASAPPSVAGGLDEGVKYARAHQVIIDRFGRFPHRNAILGRASTAEETAFLLQPGSSF